MQSKIYKYPFVNNNSQNSITLEEKQFIFEQKCLFTSFANFGYIGIQDDCLCLSDEQIIDYWNYSKDSVLKNMELDDYYKFLGLSQPYIKQIPTITEKETFISDSYQMKVSWINDLSKGNMASAPKSYLRDGIEIINFDGDILGSLYPEYFDLYKLVDDANINWKTWSKTQRYNFLDKLIQLSKKRNIAIPNNLMDSYTYISLN